MELPITMCRPRSIGCVGGVYGSRQTLCCMPPGPTSLYDAGDRGPSTIVGLGALDQGTDLRARWAVGPTREEINLT